MKNKMKNKMKKIFLRLFNIRRSIAGKIIILVWGIIFILFVFLGFFINNSISSSINLLTEQRNLEIAKIIQKDLKSFLNNGADVIERISKDYGLRSNNQVRVVARSKFKQELEETSFFERIYFISAEDEVIVEPALENKSINTKEDWIAKSKNSEEILWEYDSRSISNDQRLLSLSLPVYDYSNKFMGVLGADISEKALKDVINWNIGESGFVSFIDERANIINISDNEIFKDTKMSQYINLDNLANNLRGVKKYTYNDDDFLLSALAIDLTNGYILAQIPAKEVFAMRDEVRKHIIIFCLVILFIIAITLMIVNQRLLIKPLVNIGNSMEMIAAGNLNTKIDIKGNGEIGVLARIFNKMVNQLKFLIAGIHDSAENVSNVSYKLKDTFNEVTSASRQISNSMQSVSDNTENQALNINNINIEIQGLSNSLKEMDKTNKRVNYLKEQINNTSESGQKDIDQVHRQMSNIKIAIDKVSTTIGKLEDSSSQIDKILELINSISKQTNLLALNAAIEAARAGQAGKGFTVVAEEIQTLSEETTLSASRISQLINDIKKETNELSLGMKEGKKEIHTGEKTVISADSSFREIRKAITDLDSELIVFEEELKQSSKISESIVENIINIASMSQENSASTEEVAASSQEQYSYIQDISELADGLNLTSEELQKMIKQFDLILE
ncbi:MAG: methyl-accepting chemotaxis protein [Halanaerobiaceae bacterium]